MSMNPRQVMIAVLEIETFSCSFTKLCKLALIGLLIPVSTADCERGFSSLKRIKTTTINLRAGFCTEEEPWDYPNITAYNYIALESITSKM